MKKVYWIFDRSLKNALDKVTWLETSNELISLGWNISLIASDFPETNSKYPNTRNIQISIPRWKILNWIFYQIKVFQWINSNVREKAIIFGSAENFFTFLLIRMFNQKKRRELILVIDTRDIPVVKKTFKSIARRFLMSFCLMASHLISDYETCISEMMADELRTPKRKLIAIWPSGVSLENFEESKRKRLWNIQEGIKFIYIGKIINECNLKNLILGFLAACNIGMNAKLDFFGDGIDFFEIEDFIQKNNNKRINIRRSIPMEKIPALLGDYHVGISPIPNTRKFRMSSPLKFLEYLASGMPVVATIIQPHKRVANMSPCVFWVENDTKGAFMDAFLRVWEKKEQLEKLSILSTALVTSWTWRKSAEKLASGFEKILS
jgi:glycosyltransferase involved in cell wall biosynthesis